MEKTRVKICGLRSMEDVSYVNAVKADFAGFVFAPGKRQVDEKLAGDMAGHMRRDICRVGVFVNEKPDVITALLKKDIIQVAQLHGDEPEDEVAFIQKKTGRDVIRVIQVKSILDLAQCEHTQADLLLLDSGKGSGETFDWNLLRRMQRPFLLAGGLTPENVGRAIAQVHPFGVDVSSGVETDGRKDFEKIQHFMNEVK